MLKKNKRQQLRSKVALLLLLFMGSAAAMGDTATAQASTTADTSKAEDTFLEQFAIQTDIATKTRLNVKYVPGVVDVMYGATLRKRGYQTVLEALTRLPGFQTLTTSYRTNPNVRGNISDTFQGDVQILLNGVAQVSGNDFQPFTALDMPLSAIDRIEVIKGPGSALYGEYALNGVINIVTVRETEGGAAHISGGSFNTHSAAVTQRIEGENWQLSMTAQRRRTEGYSPVVDHDSLRADGQLLATKTPAKADARSYFDAVTVQAKYKQTQIDASYMSVLHGDMLGASAFLTDSNDYKDELSSEAFQLTQGLGNIGAGKLMLVAGIQQHHFDRRILVIPKGLCSVASPYTLGVSGPCSAATNTPGILFEPFPKDFYLDTESTVQRRYGRVQWLGDISDHQRILIEGIVSHIDVPRTRDTTNFDFNQYAEDALLRSQGGVSTTFPYYSDPQSVDKLSYNVWSLHGVEKESYSIVIQDEIKANERTRITAGIRWDYFEGRENTYSPRLALAYELSDSKLVKLQLASAFRPPSLNQEVSDAGLSYEKLDTLDAQFSHNYAKWALNHVAYVSWVNNKIIPTFTTTGVQKFEDTGVFINSSEQYRYYGFENTASFQALESLRFESNLAYAKGDGPKFQKSEFFVSPLTIDLNMTWDMNEAVQWFLEQRYWGPRERRPDDSRSGLGSQTMTNLSLSIAPMQGDRLTAIVSIENVFDEEIKAPSGWGNPESFPDDLSIKSRRISAALEYRW
jgi:outer membrane receptor for ferrienterochelin and colicins